MRNKRGFSPLSWTRDGPVVGAPAVTADLSGRLVSQVSHFLNYEAVTVQV